MNILWKVLLALVLLSLTFSVVGLPEEIEDRLASALAADQKNTVKRFDFRYPDAGMPAGVTFHGGEATLVKV